MKQILQNLRSGETELVDVPAPGVRRGHLLIGSQRSVISAGTERMLVEFGQGNLLTKARSQPDRVKQVLDKMQTDGVMPTLDAVFNKLDQPLPLGYCNAGMVLGVGEGVNGFVVGDRVVSNGPHAGVVSVPQNLCAKIPDSVSDDDAVFTVLGAIALQGIRLVNPTLGERIVVVGLGLLGLLSVQMLVANGCQVLGIDFNSERLDLARQFGAQTVDLNVGEDPITAGMTFSNGHGVDGVLVTASTKSNDLMHQAAQMSRQRGRIVLVGVVGLDIQRADFYEKELTFQVSCSYGPGRYDTSYEDNGQDYPFGFVRWTEQRNFEAVLDLMVSRRLQTAPLIAKHIPQVEAAEAYRLLTEQPDMLGIVLTYPETTSIENTIITVNQLGKPVPVDGKPVVGVIGAGNFTTGVLLPAFKKTTAHLKTIASAGGTSAVIAGRKFGFQEATTDYQRMLADPEINTIVITTRHNSHARLVVEALNANKHVFVEKPLALNREELADIQEAVEHNNGRSQLLVGFNRRFSPLAIKMASLLSARSQPVSLIYTVNAGEIPADHWTQDPVAGGGRIIGEGCHFIDLLRYLVGSPIVGVEARMMGDVQGVVIREDKMSILLDFADGSTGVIHYLANGSKKFPKERIEVFSEGRILVLDNYKSLKGYNWPGFKKASSKQDKGHAEETSAFVERITNGGEWLIPWEVLAEVTLASFTAVERSAAPPSPIIR